MSLVRRRTRALEPPPWEELAAIEWDPASIFEHTYRRLRPSAPLPRIEVTFRAFAGMNHRIRLLDGCLDVRLSDLLAGAPPAVLEALAAILLSKLYRRVAPAASRSRYRRWVNSTAIRQRILAVRRTRGRKHAGSAQGHRDLDALFDKLNREYFAASLPRPRLGWSRRLTRTHLGHYDPAHDTIVLSRLLDQPGLPAFLPEFILYHEMLHLRFPVEVCNGRRRVHSREFLREEKRFAEYREARAALRSLLA